MVGYKSERQTIEIGRDEFTGGGGNAGGECKPPSPGQVGCRGGAIFMIKQKNIIDILKYTL